MNNNQRDDVQQDNSNSMIIQTQDLQGRIEEYQVSPMLPVENFMPLVANRYGLQSDEVRLIHKGKCVFAPHILSDFHIQDGSTVHVVFRIRRG
eukprot:403346129